MLSLTELAPQFAQVRQRSLAICQHLAPEDFVVQPVVDVSPAKWHLAHTTWFWELFVLQKYLPVYAIFHDDFSYFFNSYYETVGKRVLRADRGNMTRPTTEQVKQYRAHVDEHLPRLWELARQWPAEPRASLAQLVALGLHHEQQHQELLVTDLKYILGHNPLLPQVPLVPEGLPPTPAGPLRWLAGLAGVQSIGFAGPGFCFDNELGRHRVFLEPYQIANRLVTNGEYLAFMQAGGYGHFAHWLADGWDWVRAYQVQAPLYWHQVDGQWHAYDPATGLQPLDLAAPVAHVSFYEADAYARWCGARLPTEAEWETAAPELNWGARWEWTNSAYLPYPGFNPAPGAVGEYNGKFMVNQMVLRGASVATPPGHSRASYRNFFPPDKRWQYTGIRLAKS
ncbi:MAG: ergothioneine biosynthesis protein EgtB [Bernardetiaceae bacterium]|nr:ergothioneine biosynthesis protein EgtB [Bernardetiaceae bacterium]